MRSLAQRATGVRVVAVLGCVALLATGCGSSGGGGGKSGGASGGSGAKSGASSSGGALSGSLTVDAASSLTGAFTTIKADFVKAHPGVSITFNFAASGALATQITQGAPVDVFASAAPANMDTVVKAGLASNPTDFVSNTGEIATPPKNPAKITSVRDLARSGVKVALCAPKVPCGVVATTIFKNAKITVQPSASEPDVKSTLAIIETGEVDAGIVYVTDVKAAGTKVHGVPIPSDLNATTEYPIAPLSKAKNPALARAFVDYVLSPAGEAVLTAAGFAKP